MCVNLKTYLILPGDLNFRHHECGASTYPLCYTAVYTIHILQFIGRYNWEFLNLSHYLDVNVSHDDQPENEYTNHHINPLVIYFLYNWTFCSDSKPYFDYKIPCL